ncbi:prepilin-type N-terminal cleavage/methylation domain-containing protein [candidate division WWE3 bacterium]|uniref:Prepilin-type N-terminal cleavage/methylation domain-containing protein n=1 Tax=candidate division WWE3 bacterium TaxID=2053526 RepID=A0A7X9E6U0_UNCKA|nr:prepilin-type N-terminal cleavage/methylation domain-containing protein [candidate division WWE3 bacterium]
MTLPTKNSAFTLIELLLVVTIISIISVGVIPAFTSYIRNQNLKQAQEQIKSDLRSTQNKALTGSLSDQFIGSALMKFWGIKFTNNSSTYDFFISSVDDSCPINYVQGQYQGNGKLSNNLRIQNFNEGQSGCLFFNVQDGGISSPGFGSAGSVVVGYSVSEVKNVFFNSSGLIYSTND